MFAKRERGAATIRLAVSAALIALCAFVLSGCAQNTAPAENASDASLRIAVEGNFPPFSEVTPSGELVGFDVDVASALCNEMKRKCELVQQRWDRMFQGLVAGEYDMIVSSMHPTNERRRVVDFTDKYRSDPSLFVAPSGVTIVDTPSGMTGKAIGVMWGSPQDSYVSAVFVGSEIRRFSRRGQLYAALYKGELDSVFDYGHAAEATFLKSSYGDGFGLHGRARSDSQFFGEAPAIAIRKDNGELKSSLNAAIKTIRANGRYESINSEYFSFDIY